MSTQQSITSCQTCGEPLEVGWDQCPSCLTPTITGELTCPECGKEIKSKWKQCPYCKTTLEGWATPTRGGNTSSPPKKEPAQKIALTLGGDVSDEAGSGLDFTIETGEVLVERYTIRKMLGSGNFGGVYLASDSVLNKDIALKIVKTGEGKALRATEQLLHEFQLREKITDTSHILKAYDPRQADYKNLSILLLPVELADRGSLRKWMVKNPQNENRFHEGLQYFEHACRGVQAIHEAGLVHLDLKPENILLVENRAKIADFGIGRFWAYQFGDNPEQLLRQGVGTPQYMSPEQFKVARQKDIGPKSDIYSLGIILYELLDGNPPFDGSPVELRHKHLEMEPTPLTGAVEPWWRLVKKCLEKRSEARYPSVEKLLCDLHRMAEGLSLTIDVSCPQCGHVTGNSNAKICEKCGGDLAELFRVCPTCKRQVRLDVDLCPGCGKNVAKHYFIHRRKDEIEKLKDEDPVEAIELLESMLREGAEEYHERAITLVRDLREKQESINSLLDEAEQKQSGGDLDQTLQVLQTVLEIIPRHRIALEKYDEIDALLGSIQQRVDEATSLADQASFRNAEKLFRECLELYPSGKNIKPILDSLPKREKTFSSSLELAESAMEQKAVHDAKNYIERALAAAPKSKNALEMQKQIIQTLDQTKLLIVDAEIHLDRAEFDEVEKCIAAIEEQQLDEPQLAALKQDLPEIRERFECNMEQSVQSQNEKDLHKTLHHANVALECCPASQKALDRQKEIRELQESVVALLETAETSLLQAQFDQTKQTLYEAKVIWCNYIPISELTEKCKTTKIDYTTALDRAKQLLKDENFEEAKADCISAQNICPNAVAPVELLLKIKHAKLTYEKRQQEIQEYWRTVGEILKWIAYVVIGVLLVIGIVIGILYGIRGVGYLYSIVQEWSAETAWPYLMGHNHSLMYVAGCILFVTLLVHLFRHSHYPLLILLFIISKFDNIFGFLLWFLLAGVFISIIPSVLSLGIYFIAQSHYHFTHQESLTLGLLFLNIFTLFAFLYAFMARQSHELFNRIIGNY